jgi:excisionase family DNA binding protein
VDPLAVDVHEAGRLLSLSARTIRRHIQSGRIKAVRVGRRVLVPLEALIEMLNRSGGSGSTNVKGDLLEAGSAVPGTRQKAE